MHRKICVIGLRGFPNIQGGVETHCEELYSRLAKTGLDITVVRRKCFINDTNNVKTYNGIKFHNINTIKIKGFEAALHSLFGVLYAYKIKTDILHIHAIGPSIVIPIAKILGLKVIVTHHGPDYDRENWGRIAKFILKTGEYFAAKWADKIIVISSVINDILIRKYNRYDATIIYNGVNKNSRTTSIQYIESLGLIPGRYVLAVGRFVKEKEFDKLIYAMDKIAGMKLVIAGDADHKNEYSIHLKQLAKDKNVILTGIIKGEKLREIYSHAALFVLPSSHEGLPITLLEAMSYSLPVLASNISPNLELKLSNDNYYILNDQNDLIEKIKRLLEKDNRMIQYNLDLYDWDTISRQTLETYI